jgi:hypothetical protein
MKVNIVVITLKSEHNISQWGVPFTNKKEANKYATKITAYWKNNTNFICKVTVQNAMPVREKVGKDWRKAGI